MLIFNLFLEYRGQAMTGPYALYFLVYKFTLESDCRKFSYETFKFQVPAEV